MIVLKQNYDETIAVTEAEFEVQEKLAKIAPNTRERERDSANSKIFPHLVGLRENETW